MNAIEDVIRDGSKEVLKREGPLAWLAVLLVSAMLVGIGYVATLIVPAMRDYVAESTESVKRNTKSFEDLAKSMETVHQAHASMMAALETTQQTLTSSEAKIEKLIASVDAMGAIVDEARRMMSSVPEQRATQHSEQMRLLQRIDDSIKELAGELRQQQLDQRSG